MDDPQSQETDLAHIHFGSFEGKDYGGSPGLRREMQGFFIIMMQVYYGPGKGKTSAAVGAFVRAAGHGWPVLMVQFLKDAGTPSGEVKILIRLRPRVDVMMADLPFSVSRPAGRRALAQMKEKTRELLRLTALRMGKKAYRMVVLDELGLALSKGWLDAESVGGFLDGLPGGCEVIITGRRMPRWLIKRADLVTRMTMIRHPYTRGVKMREGVEF